MDTRSRSSTILMAPWQDHGHVSPFLELAKVLSRRNFYIHFCTTPVNRSSLKQSLSERDSISIKLVELQVQLPHFPEATRLTPALKEAVDMVKPGFHIILQTLKPDLVLYDFLLSWVPAVASTQNIPAVLFLCSSAASTSYTIHSLLNTTSEYPFPEFDSTIHATVSGIKESERLLDSIRLSTNVVLINTCRNLEEKHIDYLSSLCQKRIIPVGPLIQAPAAAEDEPPTPRIIEWLSKKDRVSTVFASFESEYFMSREEMEQIALGLELSGANFIWVVKFPPGEDNPIEKALPEGFLQRVGEKAMILERRAPQARILSHPSVGGFMSHCGWSSVVESIKFGVPIIAVPIHQDEPLNARLVEKMGVGEEVVRNKEGNFTKEEVERVVRKVLQGNKPGDKLVRNVKQLSMKMKENEEEEIDMQWKRY